MVFWLLVIHCQKHPTCLPASNLICSHVCASTATKAYNHQTSKVKWEIMIYKYCNRYVNPDEHCGSTRAILSKLYILNVKKHCGTPRSIAARMCVDTTINKGNSQQIRVLTRYMDTGKHHEQEHVTSVNHNRNKPMHLRCKSIKKQRGKLSIENHQVERGEKGRCFTC